MDGPFGYHKENHGFLLSGKANYLACRCPHHENTRLDGRGGNTSKSKIIVFIYGLGDHGRPWSNMVDHGRAWSIMVDHGRPWSIMVDRRSTGCRPWSTMVDQALRYRGGRGILGTLLPPPPPPSPPMQDFQT